MPQPKQCPKCSGSMTEGFIQDKTHGSIGVLSWVEGAVEKSVWTGVKTAGRKQSEIATWRCTRCGYLESYAVDAPEGGEAERKQAAMTLAVLAAAVAVLLGLLAVYLMQRG